MSNLLVLMENPLSIENKLNKGSMGNDNYCFKNIFLIIDNITNDFVLVTPFLTQIYPFRVNESGIHTHIMGKPISFNFLTPSEQREIFLLRSNSIFRQINVLRSKQSQICYLQEEISYQRIEEQLQNPIL